MLLHTSCKFRRQLLTVSRRFSTTFNLSSSRSQATLNPPDKDCEKFLPWLEKKAGAEISSKLCFTLESRHMVTVCFSTHKKWRLHIGGSIQFDVKDALVNEVDHVTKVAMVLLDEWKQGKILWSEHELDMVRASSVYEETVKQKAQIGNDFLKIGLVLEKFPDIFGTVTYKNFIHAYALVKSRAWGTPKGVSVIPFADFMNHDEVSEAIVLNDEIKQVSEVVADCNYAPQEEVRISYGKFGNATLMLNFGFTIPHNIHDQVEIQMSISDSDVLHEMKKEILLRHQLRTIRGPHDAEPPSWNFFTIREVKSGTGKGKGIPQSLRAFARVVSCNHPIDIYDLASEAAQNDGRLARRPFKDSNGEIQAHSIVLSHIIRLIDQYRASIQSLDHWSWPPTFSAGLQPSRWRAPHS